ncbi:MAG: hypothetical protein ACLFVS_04770 [Candidatus Acetothermia bacterium]
MKPRINNLSKSILGFLIFVSVISAVTMIMTRNGRKISMVSHDGYQDLSRDGSVYAIIQRKTLKFGAPMIPGDFKKNASLQVTYPALFSEGTRRVTITAENDDHHFSRVETGPTGWGA